MGRNISSGFGFGRWRFEKGTRSNNDRPLKGSFLHQQPTTPAPYRIITLIDSYFYSYFTGISYCPNRHVFLLPLMWPFPLAWHQSKAPQAFFHMPHCHIRNTTQQNKTCFKNFLAIEQCLQIGIVIILWYEFFLSKYLKILAFTRSVHSQWMCNPKKRLELVTS